MKYYNIIGRENDSWGYHSYNGYFYCLEGEKQYGPLFTTGDTIGCCLNFINGTVFYTKNGVNLGNYYLNTLSLLFQVNKDLIWYFIMYFKESHFKI